MECGFTLKRVRDMIRRYSQLEKLVFTEDGRWVIALEMKVSTNVSFNTQQYSYLVQKKIKYIKGESKKVSKTSITSIWQIITLYKKVFA